MTETLPPAVVMGLSPTGLHVVRALGRAGVAVTGVAEGLQAGRASRYLVDVIDEADPAARLETLCARFPEGSGAVLIVSSDQDAEFVMDHADRLSRHFAFQDSLKTGLAEQIMDKDSFYALCETHGVIYPRQWQCERAGLGDLADDVALPCMIKPARIHAIKHLMGGEKGWIARTAQEVRDIATKVPEGAGVLLVQEIVPGPESEITLWCGHRDAQGVMRQGFTARKLRQFPPGFGSAALVQSQPEPETAQITQRLLDAIGYQGIAASEFKRAPDGTLKIIEINIRPSLWFSVSAAAGRDVVLSGYRELAGLPMLPERPQEQGVRWRYALKDAYSALFYRRNPDFVLPAPDTEAAGPALRRIGAVYEPGDAGPALAELLNFSRKGAGRVLRKLGFGG